MTMNDEAGIFLPENEGVFILIYLNTPIPEEMDFYDTKHEGMLIIENQDDLTVLVKEAIRRNFPIKHVRDVVLTQ